MDRRSEQAGDPATLNRMQADLPLDPLVSLLPRDLPFTPSQARTVGIRRSDLDRMLRHGVLRRVVKGVYVDAAVADNRRTRALALGLAVPERRVVHGRTASWLYGVRVSSGHGLIETTDPRGLHERDVTKVEGVLVTTPVRTALDLGRTLNPDRGIATIDAFLRHGLVQHGHLLAELPRFARHPGVRQLRELVARADGRAGSAAESLLRMRWLDARLPTPIPRVRLGACWLELGLPVRRFGVAFTGRLTPAEGAAVRITGWRVVELDAHRVLGSDPLFVAEHLEREFHRHLLQQAG